MRTFWRWLALYSYRHWARAEPRKPVGIPGNRDPHSPCECYAPRRRRLQDFADCLTDGHYLCKECCHRADELLPERDWIQISFPTEGKS